jgi:hypothetical protein
MYPVNDLSVTILLWVIHFCSVGMFVSWTLFLTRYFELCVLSCYARFYFWLKSQVFPVHCMKAYRGNKGIALLILKALHRDEWLTSRSSIFTQGKKLRYPLHSTYVRWVGPITVLDGSKNGNSLVPKGIRTPDLSDLSLAAIRYSDFVSLCYPLTVLPIIFNSVN